MRTLILFLALVAHPYSLSGARIGDNLDQFSDSHLNAFCGRETPTMVVCEQDDATYVGRRAYLRAEFTDRQMTYLSLTLSADAAVAKKISASLEKEYGKYTDMGDGLPDSYYAYWSPSDSTENLRVSYTSAAQNGLGHPVLRVSLAAK